jgi:hypothetical protein
MRKADPLRSQAVNIRRDRVRVAVTAKVGIDILGGDPEDIWLSRRRGTNHRKDGNCGKDVNM